MSSSELEVKQNSCNAACYILPYMQTASAGLSRHERNRIKYLVLINLKYTLLSEHMCYMFIVHACAVYSYTVCTTEIWLLLLFHLCRQEYSLQSFTIVATLIGVAAFLFL
jgi:hypothetical protein